MMVRQWRPFRIIGENARIYLVHPLAEWLL